MHFGHKPHGCSRLGSGDERAKFAIRNMGSTIFAGDLNRNIWFIETGRWTWAPLTRLHLKRPYERGQAPVCLNLYLCDILQMDLLQLPQVSLALPPGAITTMLAGATMFVCWFYFFIKMALLICVTIMCPS